MFPILAGYPPSAGNRELFPLEPRRSLQHRRPGSKTRIAVVAHVYLGSVNAALPELAKQIVAAFAQKAVNPVGRGAMRRSFQKPYAGDSAESLVEEPAVPAMRLDNAG